MSFENRWYVKYTTVLLGLILTVYVMIVAKSILLPLLFAILLSILFAPLASWFEKYNVPRILAALLAMIIGLSVLVGLGYFFYTQITAFVDDVDLIKSRTEELLAGMEDFLVTWFDFEGFVDLEDLEGLFVEFVRENSGTLGKGVAGAVSMVTTTFLVPVFMFMFLIFRDFLKTFFLKLFGRKSDMHEDKVKTIIGNIQVVVQKYITGVMIVISILAVLNSIMLLIVGVKHAVFFGVFAALLNVIPFIGPLFGSIFPVIYSLLTMDSLIYPLIIVAGFYVIQIFEGNFFTPVIVGNQVSMNALIALLLLFLGAQIWGLAGMILFIPLGAIMKVVFDEIESLQPYGYLIGRVPDDQKDKKGKLAQKISDLKEKVSKDGDEEEE
ncbi:AI-2E family transporter [Rhodohalobacter barkolensis]|uniref:AI-2E family transporter n=1 Tax=Rhodohalobacter barkolensis TaxID=2053187 RepID=A0A2N0VLG7_9BACT|nr:AI-2E family transporter [Rhodohalobacter barkolensis]PKD44999.1 AI-2E family transporter [Rhodohalobacter barkolensis]